ncbi:MAG: amino acid adenylation domain-containing protein [Pseudomonadota bacterium]
MAANNVQAFYPVTSVQEGMLLQIERSLNNSPYWGHIGLTLEGPLDAERLAIAWSHLVATHDALRTVVRRDSKGRALQIVLRRLEAPLQHLNWDESHSAETDYRAADRERHSDPGTPPLCSLAIARLGRDSHRLILGLHHLITDGWSTALLVEQLFQIYAALARGEQPPELPAPRLEDYASYSRLCDQRIDSGAWQAYLDGLEPCLLLPAASEQQQRSTQTYTCEWHLTPGESTAVFDRAQSARVTTASLLTAVWSLTVAAETGTSQALFATTYTDRDAPVADIETLIGPLIRTVPIRVATAATQALDEWLRSTQQTLARVRTWNGSLSDILALISTTERTALFDSIFVVDNFSPNELKHIADADLRVSDYRAYGNVEFPVTVSVNPGPPLSFTIQGRTGAQDGARLNRIGDRFRLLLATLSQQDAGPPREVMWLLPGEEWAQQKSDTVYRDPLLRIRERLEAAGTRPALVHGQQQVTGRSLWNMARLVAGELTAAGVRSGDRVIVECSRGPSLVAALLGCWYCGAAYVPLDLRHPPPRRKAIAEDAQPRCILMDGCKESIAGSLPAPALNLSDSDFGTAPVPAAVAVPADAPAYLIYTSGSTGRPKGVVVSRGNVGHLFAAVQARLQCGPEDRFLAVTTVAFDIALIELLWPLWLGASTRIADAEDITVGPRLSELLSDCTVLFATPGNWQVLLDAGWQGDDRLTAICGGESLPEALAMDLLPRVKRLWNAYGPTEATVCTTLKAVGDREPITIGSPLPGVTAIVQDQAGRPLPPGVPGELVLYGPLTAVGYWQLPELTARRFVRNRHGLQGYRTGDLVAWNDSGELTFFGRRDNQVKVRGFRIELAEVEQGLQQLPGVNRACVVVDAERQALLGAVEVTTPFTSAPLNWRRLLADQLPNYMVPATVAVMKRLPLGPSGKVDRRAVTELLRKESTAALAPLGQPPQGALEELVASLWQQELGVARVPRDVSFFELGGHSLQLARIMAQLTRKLGLGQHSSASFEAQTVAAQAALGLGVDAGEAGDDRHGQQPGDFSASTVFAATPFQQRLWILDQIEASRGTHVITAAIVPPATMTPDALQQLAWQLHEQEGLLRARFCFQDGRLVGIIDEAAQLDWAVRQTPGCIEAALGGATDVTLDMAQAPLWSLRWLQEAQRSVVVLTVHHAIADGTTVELMLDRLGLTQGTATAGADAATPAFAQVAAFLGAQVDRTTGRSDREYWLTSLKGPLPVLDLPRYQARPPQQRYEGSELALEVTGDQRDRLSTAATACGVTLNGLILAAYAATLMRYSQQRELVVGTVATLRHLTSDGSLSQTFGPLLNTLPLRFATANETTLGEFITQCGLRQIEAFSHVRYPFESLLAELELDRDLSRTPVFQAFYSFLQLADTTSAEASLPVTGTRARTDLSCWVVSEPDRLRITLEYATALFEQSLIAQFLRHFRRTLDVMCEDPEQRLLGFELLEDSDRRWIADQQGPKRRFAAPHIHELMDWAGFAEREAVRDEQHALSYSELAALIETGVALLQQHGAEVGQQIGVLLRRDVSLIPALFAIWRLGAAFVPLDPDYPQARLEYVIADAKLSLLLHDDSTLELATSIGGAPGPRPVNLSQPAASQAQLPAQPTDPKLPAYVLYTSGSTGLPKGVVVSHGALANFLQSMREQPGMTADDCLLAVTTLSFDIALLELLLPLTVGARVYVADRLEVRDGRALAQLLERSRATVMQATPSGWRLLLEGGWTGRPELNALCGGEPLTPELARALLLRCNTVWNLYGPTETTIWSSIQQVQRAAAPVAIGRPIANTTIAILDNEGLATPPGVPGQIWIGGAGLAEGYWQRPELTAERFTQPPALGGARYYATGDRGLWRSDGTLLCLGRDDGQIKLRGHRLELGEVETALRQLPDVLDAAAVVEGGQEQRLIGFLKGPAAVDFAAARQALARRLPSHALPQALFCRDSLPVTPNGKLDRAVLLKELAGLEQLPVEASQRLPASPAERLLAETVGDLLQLAHVDLSARFFELGGHSLLAMQLVGQLENRCGYTVPIASILLEPLAVIAAQLPVADEASEVGMSARSATGPASRNSGGWFSRWRQRLRR